MNTSQEMVAKAYKIALIARKYKYKHWLNYEGLTVDAIKSHPEFPDMEGLNYQIVLNPDDCGIYLEIPQDSIMETILMASMMFKAVMAKVDDEIHMVSEGEKLNVPSILNFCHLENKAKILLLIALK